MSIEAIVLGRAQDAGVPQAGCWCANCAAVREGKRPREFAACLAIVDRDEKRFWLIDATPDFREQLAMLPREFALAGIFLTHAHIGHYTGLMHLGREAMNTRDMPVHGTPRMCAFLRSNAPWSQLVSLGNIKLHEHQPGEKVALHDRLSVEFCPVPHRGEFSDTMAFIIHGPTKSLFYCPDIDSWDAWSRDVRKLPDDFDVSIIDGTFFSGDELPGRDMSKIPHPTIQRTMELIGNGKGKVLFTHLNHTNPLFGNEAPEIRSDGYAAIQIAESVLL